MITRELDDERTILIRQEDHADLAAQFASHWGNEIFSPPDPYNSVVCAAAFHDGHFRDSESPVPIDLKLGRPFGHRTVPFSLPHLDSLQRNIEWVNQRDRYAALLVSMHHSGLPQNRYGVINSWQNDDGKAPRKRVMRPELAATVQEMEAAQRIVIRELDQNGSAARKQLWFNYRLLQVFDLLSLYLCSDGYSNGGLKEAVLDPIPLAPASDQEVSIHVIPTGEGTLRLDPYPFDCRPLEASVMTRVMRRRAGFSEAECQGEFLRSSRTGLTCTITN